MVGAAHHRDQVDDPRRGKTAVPVKQLKEIGKVLTTLPEGFTAHKTIQRFLETRAKMFETGGGSTGRLPSAGLRFAGA